MDLLTLKKVNTKENWNLKIKKKPIKNGKGTDIENKISQ
jgi:hypothetical protein